MGRELCYSMREFGKLCWILRPLQAYNRAFCRNVGISRESCTFPSQKSDDSTPPMSNFHASWITPKSRPLLTGYYTTWQSLADFVEILQSPSISATFRHRSSLTTPNYGVMCRRMWYYQVFKVRLFLICCFLSCVKLLLLICYTLLYAIPQKRYIFLKKNFLSTVNVSNSNGWTS